MSAPRLVNQLTDWESFSLQLEENINLSVFLKNEEQLDNEVELFMNFIQQAAWDNTPKIVPQIKGNNYPQRN